METLNQSALASEFDLQVAAHIATKQATYNAEMKLIKLLIRFSFEHKHFDLLFPTLLFILYLPDRLRLFLPPQRDIHTMSRGTTLFSCGTVGELSPFITFFFLSAVHYSLPLTYNKNAFTENLDSIKASGKILLSYHNFTDVMA